MERHSISRFFPVIIAAVLCVSWQGTALCAPNPSETPYETRIEGEDHVILKDFFARFEQNGANRIPGEAIRRVLLQALPDVCKNDCEETADQLGHGADGTTRMTVKILFVNAREEEKPIRALIAFVFLSEAGDFTNRFHELTAALVIDRDSSRLSIVQQDPGYGKCREFGRIAVEREVRIGGRDVVGLRLVRLNENPPGGESTSVLREERINFYVFEDNGIRPAGSVLKAREERQSGDTGEVKSVYTATVVFKKDMKGNIVGILSPYTTTMNDARTEKGMVRYIWDSEKEAFVKE